MGWRASGLLGLLAAAAVLLPGAAHDLRPAATAAEPVPVRRLAAATAVDAALVLSREAFPTGASTALLARADDFADALATGGVQGRWDAPLLLTPADRLADEVRTELGRLGVRRVQLLGGPAALSEDVERSLQTAGLSTSRWAGQDRVGTSVAAAAAAFPDAPVALLVRGFAGAEPTAGFADALAVGAWAAEQRWPTLLTRTDRLPVEVLGRLRAAGTRRVLVVGGPAAVGEPVLADLRAAGLVVERVAGADRAATAVEVALRRRAPTAAKAGGVLLLDGSSAGAWAPGVASAALAARQALPVVLAVGDALPAASRRWLGAAPDLRPLVCGPLATGAVCDMAAAVLDRGPLAGLVVALDPGHNRDNGRHAETRRLVDAGGFLKECNTTGTATDDGYPESLFNHELAVRLARRLEALGATVPRTRAEDVGWGPCIDARGRFGAASGARLMLSLHADGSTAPGAVGFHVIRPAGRAGWTDDVEAPSARLATHVRDALVAAGFAPSTYRGVAGIDVRGDLGTLNWADVPTVVVETHNMRNRAEAALFRSPDGQERLAAALAAAVRAHLGA